MDHYHRPWQILLILCSIMLCVLWWTGLLGYYIARGCSFFMVVHFTPCSLSPCMCLACALHASSWLTHLLCLLWLLSFLVIETILSIDKRATWLCTYTMLTFCIYWVYCGYCHFLVIETIHSIYKPATWLCTYTILCYAIPMGSAVMPQLHHFYAHTIQATMAVNKIHLGHYLHEQDQSWTIVYVKEWFQLCAYCKYRYMYCCSHWILCHGYWPFRGA